MENKSTTRPRFDSPSVKDDEHIQDNCTHGYVLPDRCRYTAHLGCDCGAYRPLRWDAVTQQYVDRDS